MTTEQFISKIKEFELGNDSIKVYPEINAKILSRFWERLFWIPDVDHFKNGWLGELYKTTNGVDLFNYYIVPNNNYFNKKAQSFDDFCREWIVNQDNPNEILADFYSFMTDRHSLIGYLENLKNEQGEYFIGYTKGVKNLKNVDIIFSSVFKLYNYIIECLSSGIMIDFNHPIGYWRERDEVLDKAYSQNKIEDYKIRFLFQNNSDYIQNL